MTENRCGIDCSVRNRPELDPGFLPIGAFLNSYSRQASKPFALAVENPQGDVSVIRTSVIGREASQEADHYAADRLLKILLSMKGGTRITVSGDRELFESLKAAYSPGGSHGVYAANLAAMFRTPMEFLWSEGPMPEAVSTPKSMGGHFDGCRIGLDAGASSIKYSAVKDGVTVLSDKLPWEPTVCPDPGYHFEKICRAIETAKKALPRVDAVGISSAGDFAGSTVMAASLFGAVGKDRFDSEVREIYLRAVRTCCGDVPCEVINDGDVTAIAGMISLGTNNLLGISMGSSEAGGYVDGQGRVTGWLNELAYVPVDCRVDAPVDSWSLDYGSGEDYFSMRAVLRLAAQAGITVEGDAPSKRVGAVLNLVERGDDRARAVFRTIGAYLAHTLPFYESLYHMEHVLLLGGVTRGLGGDLILSECMRILREEYPETAGRLSVTLPDGNFRRLGQSVAAASLPVLQNNQNLPQSGNSAVQRT